GVDGIGFERGPTRVLVDVPVLYGHPLLLEDDLRDRRVGRGAVPGVHREGDRAAELLGAAAGRGIAARWLRAARARGQHEREGDGAEDESPAAVHAVSN